MRTGTIAGLSAMVAALWIAGCGNTVTATGADGSDGGIADVATWLDTPTPIDRAAAPDDAGVAFDADPGDDREAPDAAPEDRGQPGREDRPDVTPLGDVPGSDCASAAELRDGDVLTGQRFGGAPSTLPACGGSSTRTAVTRWYRATVPPDAVLGVDVTGVGRDSPQLEVTAWAACDAAACLARAYSGRTVGPLRVHNAGAAPQTVLVAVAVLGSRPEDAVATVSARIRPRASNSTCATATPLAEGVTLPGQDLALSTERMRSCLDPSTDTGAPALYYSVTVPPRSALVVQARREGTATNPLSVTARPPCGAPGCLPNTFSAYTSDPSAQYNNAAGSPQSVTVAVAAPDSAPLPVVDVTARFRALPAESQCASAGLLVDGVATRLEHPEDATEATPRCPGASDVPPRALYYAITVPPGQTLTVTADAAVTGGSAQYAFVRLFTACGGTCLAASLSEVRSPRAVFSNTSVAPQRIVVAAGTLRPEQASPLSLRASLRPVSTNLTCAGALPLTPGTPIAAIDLLEAQQPSPCGNSGPVLYYSVRVTTGSTLTLRVTGGAGSGGSGPYLSLLASCEGVCLARAGSAGASLSYVHRGAAQDVVVALGTNGPTPSNEPVTLSALLE